VAAARRPTVDQAPQILIQPGHIESPVLHAHVDIIGPGAGVEFALFIGENMAGVAAHVIDRLVLRQQFDGAIDAWWHEIVPLVAKG
jgi:hypothetical protein